ncbi:EscJ/YscJ/HrcJ family type III secretion inner membrane ring protein [Luteimonas arsenica]|uniref:EscJ/YscJ/HrcJ family type III secretion inner membrane ring protein n=1 Tax=Luteimonas arsenica TaxID=1586242 RepID=UPI001055C477|nr:EscJ/YscJ/HrcJ family type III secretion inner membrane ring protein [Luteimonas arsenica]
MKFLRWSRPLRATLFAFAAAALLAACGGKPLYSQLDEGQANQIMGVLIAAGIDADKNPSPSKVGWEVRVATSDFPYAMQVLGAHGLPRAQFANTCDVFKKEGFASSSTEERGREQCSLQQELADTLTRFPGVVDARVHVTLAERDPLGGSSQDSSASVAIFEAPGASARDREADIKLLIKDAVPGLVDLNKVTVKFAEAPAMPARKPQGPALSAISPTALAIAAGVVLLLGLLVAFRGRLRNAAQPAKASDQVWNG